LHAAIRDDFERYEHAEVVELHWAQSAAEMAASVLKGMETLYYCTDNGTQMLEHCRALNAAIKLAKLTAIVKAHLNTELSHVERFKDFPFIKQNLTAERWLAELAVPTLVLVRPAAVNENVAFWWADEIRKYRSLVFAPNVCWNWIGAAEAAECIARILLDPIAYKGQTIPLVSDSLHFEEMCEVFSQVAKFPVHFVPLEKKEDLREYLLHDGFSVDFLDDLLLPMLYDQKVSKEEAIAALRPASGPDWPTRLLGRPPKDFSAWLRENLHYFIE